ncbi:POC1 centriolar protein homolog A-like [Bolinopsis microptera]|uniref:POC1 centriolar protein homolog A-like n=1 Tax=Bolinopsis microptera TaxID=2820187 RepID=UPI00307A9388
MVLDPENLSLVRSWGCEDNCYHHSYNTATHKLISSHRGYLAVWDPDSGEKLFSRSDDSRYINCVDSHLTESLVISGNNNLEVVEWEITEQGLQILRKVELPRPSGWTRANVGVTSVKYSVDGVLIYCAEWDSQSIKIYNKESEKVGELKGHSYRVNKISTVPGVSRMILSSGSDQSIIWSLPSSGDVDACKQELDEEVQWVGFSVGEELFATVTDNQCRLWDSTDLKVVRSVEFGGFDRSKGEFHPDGECLFLNSRMGVLVYNLQLELLKSYEVLKSEDGSTTDLKITPDGSKFLVTECRNMTNDHLSKAFVWNCSDPSSATEHLIKE